MSVQTLLDSVNCYACQTPGEWKLLELALLRQIALQQNPAADVSVQGLLDQAACFNCFGPGLWPVIELVLLNIIAGGSGGTVGGCCIQCGDYGGGQPNFTPDTGCCIATDTSINRPWFYFSGAWH